jgi:type VI secretion system protein ImpA
VSEPFDLDIDSLIAPIPGPDPAGVPLPDAIEHELNELRRQTAESEPNTAGRHPEWGKIVRIASDTLATKSKDLRVATRLVEAVTRKEGVAGLREGLRLLHRLVAVAWDRLYPRPAEGEELDRGYLFVPLNDDTPSQPGKPKKFLEVVREMPLVQPDDHPIAYLDWLQPARKAEVEQYIPKAGAKELRFAHDDLTAALQALKDLSAELDAKTKEAPNFLGEDSNNLGTAIGQCIGLVKEIAERRGVSLTDEPPGGPDGGTKPSAHGDGGKAGPVGVASNREGLYRQLREIAERLKVIEPHSPVPFLLERCVKLGSLPFPELMRAIVRETATLDELDRLLGLAKKE